MYLYFYTHIRENNLTAPIEKSPVAGRHDSDRLKKSKRASKFDASVPTVCDTLTLCNEDKKLHVTNGIHLYERCVCRT